MNDVPTALYPLLVPLFENFPAQLVNAPQWVVWKGEWLPEKGKYNKIPFDAKTGKKASSTDPATWATFEQAKRCYQKGRGYFAGVGFVLSAEDAFAGVDLDSDCPQEKSDAWVALLDSYTEVSPSGKGLRVFVLAKLPPGDRKRGPVECYQEGRFLTVTGHTVEGTPVTIEERQLQVECFHLEAFPVKDKPKPHTGRSGGVGEGLLGSDSDLISKACQAKNGGAFSALYSGDMTGYGSQSEADLALCNRLVFWTGPDPARLDRLFRDSGLYRDKWNEAHHANGETYGEHTIAKAIAGCSTFYSPVISRNGTHTEGKNGAVHGPNMRKPETGDADEQETFPLFALTDLGNAERVNHRHGKNLRYCPAHGWLVWDGKRWQPDESGEVYRRTEETIRKIPIEASAFAQEAASLPAEDTDGRAALAKKVSAIWSHAVKSESAPRIEAVVRLLQHLQGIFVPPPDLDADDYLLNVQNGIIDLRTGKLLPHRQEAYCTKICPVGYYPDAVAPVWTKCMETWIPDVEVRLYLQRSVGYSLTGNIGEETAFLLYGFGRNGKSKFTSTIEHLMGTYAGRSPIEVFMESGKRDNGPSPDKANLAGLRMVIASEIPKGRRFNEASIKDMTGGDPITAAHKYQKPFTYKPQMKIWLYGNHKPIIVGGDDGIKARLPLIPFSVTIPLEDRDPDLDQKLRDESEGILAWAVKGCLQWKEIRLSAPAAIDSASASYHNEMDIVAGFFRDRCVFGGGKAVWTPSAELRTEMADWVRSEGLDERNLPKPYELAERLRRMGCDDNGGKAKRVEDKSFPGSGNTKPAKCWSNVRIMTEQELLDPSLIPVFCNPVTQVGVVSESPPYGYNIANFQQNRVTGVTGLQTSLQGDYEEGTIEDSALADNSNLVEYPDYSEMDEDRY